MKWQAVIGDVLKIKKKKEVEHVVLPHEEMMAAWQNGEALKVFQLGPVVYMTWWKRMLRDAPEHVFVETVLIVFLVFVLFAGRRQRAKIQNQVRMKQLSEDEIETLLAEWEPAPLVPELKVKKSAKRARRVITQVTGDKLRLETMGSQQLLNCGGFDLLGMGSKDSIKQAAKAALTKYGCGSCGPRGFYGSIDVHEELEIKFAEFLGTDKAIAFSDASSCATSTIAAFAKRGDLLVVDEAISEPLKTGCILSRANVLAYRHNDASDLLRVLEAVENDDKKKNRSPASQRRFVITEAISRDVADLAPLRDIIALKNRFGYRLILDEGLSFGVLGETGRGLHEAQEIPVTEIDALLIDLGPALGSVGGLCLGATDLIEHQRLSGAGYCFSAAAPPFVSSCALEALRILKTQSSSSSSSDVIQTNKNSKESTLQRLHLNAAALRKNLKAAGLVPRYFLDLNDTLNDPRNNVVPFVLLALANPSNDISTDLATLTEITHTIAHLGFALAIAHHALAIDNSAKRNLPANFPQLPAKPLAIRITTRATHDAVQLRNLCNALRKAAQTVLAVSV